MTYFNKLSNVTGSCCDCVGIFFSLFRLYFCHSIIAVYVMQTVAVVQPSFAASQPLPEVSPVDVEGHCNQASDLAMPAASADVPTTAVGVGLLFFSCSHFFLLFIHITYFFGSLK